MSSSTNTIHLLLFTLRFGSTSWVILRQYFWTSTEFHIRHTEITAVSPETKTAWRHITILMASSRHTWLLDLQCFHYSKTLHSRKILAKSWWNEKKTKTKQRLAGLKCQVFISLTDRKYSLLTFQEQYDVVTHKWVFLPLNRKNSLFLKENVQPLQLTAFRNGMFPYSAKCYTLKSICMHNTTDCLQVCLVNKH